MRALQVAVTGNSGCGQSTVADVFESLGAQVCSLDEVGHRLLSRQYVITDLAKALSMPELHERSSEDVRKILGRDAFCRPGMLRAINGVLHPRMVRWCGAAAAAIRGMEGVFVLEGALVLEMRLSGLFEATVVVRDSFERCAARLASTSGLSTEVLRGRWDHQLDIDEKTRRADYVLDNSGTLDDLKNNAAALYRAISDL